MRYPIGFALLLPMVVFAKDPPLPDALLNAKTAFVEKVGSAQESFDKNCTAPKANAGAADKEHDRSCKELKVIAKADKQFFDKFCKELNKWGRFTLVQDRSSADVRILLGRTFIGSGQQMIGQQSPVDVERRVEPGYIPIGTAYTYEGNKTSNIMGGNVNGINTGFVYTVPLQSSPPVYTFTSNAISINIKDRRNDALLYLDQAAEPEKLVVHLKKGMKQK
jgi:hypothetical protein